MKNDGRSWLKTRKRQISNQKKTSSQWDSACIGNDRQRIDQGQRLCSTFARVRAALLNEVVTIVTIEIQTFV